MGQSLESTGGTGGTGSTGARCCWQDGKRSIDKNPGVSAAVVHLNSDAVGPEPVPELSESDLYEPQGTV